MPKTAEEQLAWEVQCYGCTASALEEIVEESLVKDSLFLAVSMLSDAQEEIELCMQNEARQTINRAKWMIKQAEGKE